MTTAFTVFGYVATASFLFWAVVIYRTCRRPVVDEGLREDDEVAMLEYWWSLPEYEEAS